MSYSRVSLISGDGSVVNIGSRKQTPSGAALDVQIGPGDVVSNIPVFMNYDHHQIHEGEMFHNDIFVRDLGASVAYNIVLNIPHIDLNPNAVTVCPHLRYEVATNDICTFHFYEGASVQATGGVTLSPINYERNGTYTSKTSILSGASIINNGSLIDSIYLLASSTSQSKANNYSSTISEFVLKENTKYLLQAVSLTSGCDIHMDLRWYEDLAV